ncbi:MAG: kelch repeat-containing protein [Dehalococcoidia bacterium]
MTRRAPRLSRRDFLRSAALGGSGLLAAYALACEDGDDAASSTATPPPDTAVAATPDETDAPLSFSWRRLATNGLQPAPRRDHSLVAAGSSLVLFGGRGPEGTMQDLWRYDVDADAWTEFGATGPSARFGHNAVWDSARERVAVFGGQAASAFFNDLWSFDPASNAWLQLSAGAGPAPRYGAAAAIDTAGRLVLSHGFTDSGRFDDTWLHDLASGVWTDVSPAEGPRPVERCLMRAVWDSKAQRLLMFGGQTDATPYLGDLWAFDGAGWNEIAVDPKPSPRKFYAMAFDPDAGRAVLVGGDTEDGPANDVWTFDSATNAWTQHAPSGEAPSPRSGHDAVWLADRRSLVVFGGNDGTNDLNDLWELTVT